MSIRFGRITRGLGKIYRLASLGPCPEQATVSIRSRTVDGHEVPCEIVHYHGDQWLLILPVLTVIQDVDVEVSAPDGYRESATLRMRPFVAELDSKRNTFFRNEDILSVRNYDMQALLGFWELSVGHVIRDFPSGMDILQGNARLIARGREELEGEVDLRAQDRDGSPCASDAWIVLKDVIGEAPEGPGWFARTVQFSFRIPASQEGLIIAFEGCGATGFRSLMPEDLAAYRNGWTALTTNAYSDPGYADWLRGVHEASHAELKVQRFRKFDWMPKFSVVVPLFNTPLDYFAAMVSSVMRQSYQNFELVLVNASPSDVELSRAVEELASSDDRVCPVRLMENEGISRNTNAGIRAASGDFVVFLDHDDRLAYDALYCLAKAINEDPEADLLYSDEDHLDRGVYLNPFFKPDWSPDLLLGMNYICHLMCIRASVLRQIDLPGPEFDGSQDHYLALAAGERARSVVHIPRILYHWRIHAGSTANNISAKPYAVEAGRLAVQAHLDRTGAHAKAEHSSRVPGRYEVRYELQGKPLVSIVIPNKDSAGMLGRCLSSVREHTTYQDYEVVIVENNSVEQATFDFYERACAGDPRVRVVRYEGAFNYSAIVNKGVAESHGEYLLLLNNDVEAIEQGWLERMLSLAMREGTGAVGAKLLYPDGVVQHCGVVMVGNAAAHLGMYQSDDDPGYVDQLQVMRDVSAVTGACLMTSRATYEKVGGMDEGLPVDYNDVDFCLKIVKSGDRVVIDPSVRLFHKESVSRGYHAGDADRLQLTEDTGKMMYRWPAWYAFSDPYYNENFSQTNQYFRLR